VPNQRHPNQKLIAFALDSDLRAAIETGRKMENRDQSTFIRQAIIGRLQQLKIPVDPALAFAPDRTRPEKTDKAKLSSRPARSEGSASKIKMPRGFEKAHRDYEEDAKRQTQSMPADLPPKAPAPGKPK